MRVTSKAKVAAEAAMRRSASLLVALALAFVSVACTSGRGSEARAGVVEVASGRTMYFECSGQGGPTVVLVSGKGNRADTWRVTSAGPSSVATSVLGQTEELTRVCAYDRPGTIGVGDEPSRSDPVPDPVTAKEGVADLHAWLTAARIPGPYVLVGHSYGGLIARLYASTHPENVAGLVLEDALSEGLYAGLSPAHRDVLEMLNLEPERVDTVSSFAQVVAAPGVPTVPMIILTADQPPISLQDVASGGLPPAVTAEFVTSLWSAQIAAQDALAKLFPAATHVTKTNSRHYIHLEQPQLVVDAIRTVVYAVRGTRP